VSRARPTIWRWFFGNDRLGSVLDHPPDAARSLKALEDGASGYLGRAGTVDAHPGLELADRSTHPRLEGFLLFFFFFFFSFRAGRDPLT